MPAGFVPIGCGIVVTIVAHMAALPERWFVTAFGVVCVILGGLLVRGEIG